MKNPLRDEASAFQVVLATLGCAVLIVVAAWISTWLGVVVFLVLVARRAVGDPRRHAPPAAAGARRARRGGADPAHPRRRERDRRRGASCSDAPRTKADGMREDVLLVCPALNSRVRTWTSDEDGARAAAQSRLDASLARLAAARASPRGARSATATRCRRSRTRCGVSGRRDRGLDPPAGPLALARAGRRRARARCASTCPSRTSSSTSRPRLAPTARPRYLPALSATNVATACDLRLAELALERRHPALAVRDAVDREVERRLRLVEVRADGAARPAAASVWQPPQPAEAKIALPSRLAALGRRRLRRVRRVDRLAVRVEARDRRDVASRRPPRPGPSKMFAASPARRSTGSVTG